MHLKSTLDSLPKSGFSEVKKYVVLNYRYEMFSVIKYKVSITVMRLG